MPKTSPLRAAEFALGVASLALAAVAAMKPGLLAARADHPGALPVVAALWLPFLGLAVLAFACAAVGAMGDRRLTLVGVAAGLLAFAGGALPLRDWLIDDAGITFAYAKHLAEGHGLVSQPGHAPEEGYSNTLWTLLLAAAHAIGCDVPATAKALCLLTGGACVALVAIATLRTVAAGRDARAWDLMAPLAVALGAPFLVWSTSGLEHGLQALCMLLMALAPMLTARPEPLMAVAGGALVLVRPEAPLAVAAATTAHWLLLRKAGDPRPLRRAAVVALLPFAAWCALGAFRLAYFGDLMSNPYYAKAESASFARLLNPLGGGWGYVFDWMAASGAAVLLPTLAAAGLRHAPRHVVLAAALVGGHLAFVVSVQGDWMGQFRFVSPLLPLLAVMLGHALQELRARIGEVHHAVLATASALLLALFGFKAMTGFVAAPTTPFAVVSAVSAEFERVAAAMGVADPSIAHHDAGGTTWRSGLRLLDLAGLCERRVAKSLGDRDRLRDLALDEFRPTFFYGKSDLFADKAARFADDPRFVRDYAPLVFARLPQMAADYCHVRRDQVRACDAVRIERDGDRIVRVVVL